MTEPTPNPRNSGLAGVSCGALSSEHDDLLRRSIESQGGTTSICVTHTTSDEKKLLQVEHQSISDFVNQLLTGQIEIVVFVTATGVNYLIEQAARHVDRQRCLDALSDITTIAGSQAAAESFRQQGIEPTITIKRATAWRDLLIAIDQKIRVSNFNVGLEESDSIHGLSAGLEARGGRVFRLPVYPQVRPAQDSAAVNFFEQLETATFPIMLFTSPASVARYYFLAQSFGRSRLIRHLLDNHLVLAIGPESSELLQDRQIPVDYTTVATGLTEAIAEISERLVEIQQQKQRIRLSLSGPATSGSDPNAPWYDSPFMKACRGEPTDITPVWLMRQAGRYMAEYRQIRDQISFLDLCANPQLCSEVMCTAVKRLGVDAAIIFSDLLPMLVPMGMDLEFAKGDGPVIHNPIRSTADIDRVKPLESNAELQFVMETVTQTRQDLPEDLPLIGFAGAPFTLASYMIEGGASRNFAHTKKLMYTDHGAWDQLMQHLSVSISIYLNGQIAAGAQCVQLFDSWVGCLGVTDYKKFVHPYVKQIIASLPKSVPVINFATGNPALLPLLADTRAAVIGIDWRVRLDDAWQTVGYDRSVQGNLDPTVLLTDRQEITRQTKFVLDQAAGRPGHIFNLGHGILPQTPVENAIALVDAVHELSQS